MPKPSERSIQKILERRNKVEAERDSEEWYELEYSRPQADDWYTAGSPLHSDTLARAKDNMNRQNKRLDWRIVKKTLITEVIEP